MYLRKQFCASDNCGWRSYVFVFSLHLSIHPVPKCTNVDLDFRMNWLNFGDERSKVKVCAFLWMIECILKNTVREFLQILLKLPPGLKDELIRLWSSKVKDQDHCDFTSVTMKYVIYSLTNAISKWFKGQYLGLSHIYSQIFINNSIIYFYVCLISVIICSLITLLHVMHFKFSIN